MMNPEQFKEYYKTTRETLWMYMQESENAKSKIKKLLESESAHAMNIRRYKEYPKTPNVGDLKRCQNTMDEIDRVMKTAEDVRKKIEKQRATLFNPDTVQLKQMYRSVELNKYDLILDQISSSVKESQDIRSKLQCTLSKLRESFSQVRAEAAEHKRKKQQKKDVIKKKRRRTVQSKVKSANKVTQLLCAENLVTRESGKQPELKRKITSEEFKNFDNIKLLPKLHLKGLALLIQLHAFENEERAESILGTLTAISIKPKADKPKPKKLKETEKKSQAAFMANWLSSKPSTSASSDTNVSDQSKPKEGASGQEAEEKQSDSDSGGISVDSDDTIDLSGSDTTFDSD